MEDPDILFERNRQQRLKSETTPTELLALAERHELTMRCLNFMHTAKEAELRGSPMSVDDLAAFVGAQLSQARADERERCAAEIDQWGKQEPVPSIAAAIRSLK